MYSIIVTDCCAGKTVREMLSAVMETDSFKQKHGSIFTETSCIVTLDERVVIYTALDDTIVSTGQSIKVYPLGHGG
jgi:hypothetical protein